LSASEPGLRIADAGYRADATFTVTPGADAFVPKPFNVDDLLAVLHGLATAS
jgi:DNA-binding response OmpR family regulator